MAVLLLQVRHCKLLNWNNSSSPSGIVNCSVELIASLSSTSSLWTKWWSDLQVQKNRPWSIRMEEGTNSRPKLSTTHNCPKPHSIRASRVRLRAYFRVPGPKLWILKLLTKVNWEKEIRKQHLATKNWNIQKRQTIDIQQFSVCNWM